MQTRRQTTSFTIRPQLTWSRRVVPLSRSSSARRDWTAPTKGWLRAVDCSTCRSVLLSAASLRPPEGSHEPPLLLAANSPSTLLTSCRHWLPSRPQAALLQVSAAATMDIMEPKSKRNMYAALALSGFSSAAMAQFNHREHGLNQTDAQIRSAVCSLA